MWRTRLLFVLLVFSVFATTRSADAQVLQVEWSGQRISVVARNVALAVVIDEVGKRTGSTVVGLDKISGPITVEIRDARLPEALRTLLLDFDYLVTRSPTGTGELATALLVHGPSNDNAKANGAATASTDPCSASARNAATRGGPCDPANDATVGWVSPPAPVVADGSPVVPFQTGPPPLSEAQVEVRRLHEQGVFNSDAPEAHVLAAAKSPYEEVRIRALEMLAVRGTKAGMDAIKAALEDESLFVRGEAMGLLASQSPGPETVRLLGDLIEHQDPTVRSSAAMTLGEQTGAEAEFLLKRASYGDDDAIKDIAARALQERERQQELEKAKQK